MRTYRPRVLTKTLLTIFFTVNIVCSAFAVISQNYPASVAEESGSLGAGNGSNVGTLLQTPPAVIAAPLGADDVRLPVDPPSAMVNQATQRVSAYLKKTKQPVAATPSNNAMPLAGVQVMEYVIQRGDTAPKIAKNLMGNANRWKELLDYNQITDPNSLLAGQRLLVPMINSNYLANQESNAPVNKETIVPSSSNSKTSALAINTVPAKPQPQALRKPVSVSAAAQSYEAVEPEPEYANNTIAPKLTKAPVVKAKTPAKAKINELVDADAGYYDQRGGTYTVQRGDTLGTIAKKLMGSSKYWRDLAKANPQINPNRIEPGMVLHIPGMESEPAANTVNAQRLVTSAPQSFDAGNDMLAPTYEPPPAAPPPPSFTAPTSALPPAPPMPSAPSAFEPPPPPPYISNAPTPPAPPVNPTNAQGSTSLLYREEKYRIPDELKPTNYYPYFANLHGSYGLLETESAFLPYLKTWHFGVGFRYDNYKYFNGKEHLVDGHQWIMPVNVLYTGKKMMAGISFPYQSWEVKSSTGDKSVDLSGAHDAEIKFGYQVWKNYEGTDAVTLHVGGRFSSDNYHSPLSDFSGKSRLVGNIGPAGATKGNWLEFGGAYSGRVNERWASHINLGIANDSDDSITKYIYRGGMDYRVNQHMSLIGELNGETYNMEGGHDGPNVDLVLGVAVFNEKWQGTLGFPISLQSEFGYGHDYGVIMGINTKWD